MYLTSISITPDPKLAELREDEVTFVERAKADGVIRYLVIANDRSTVHIVFDADSEAEVRAHVSRFPYAPWFTIDAIVEVLEG